MKRILSILTLSLFFVLSTFGDGEAVFTEVVGKVEYKSPGGSWQTAAEGAAITLNDTIATGFNSHAVIDFGTSTITFKPLTRMSVDKYLQDNEGQLNTSLYLRVGGVRAKVKSTEGVRQNFKISSPYSTASVRGSEGLISGSGKKIESFSGIWFYSTTPAPTVSTGEGTTTPGTTDDETTEEPSADDTTAEDTTDQTIPVQPGQSFDMVSVDVAVATDPGMLSNQVQSTGDETQNQDYTVSTDTDDVGDTQQTEGITQTQETTTAPTPVTGSITIQWIQDN